jgi:hypothetical protein
MYSGQVCVKIDQRTKLFTMQAISGIEWYPFTLKMLETRS